VLAASGHFEINGLVIFYHDTQQVPTRYHDKRINKAKSELGFESS
jgi:hypothetical protein